MGNAFKIAVRGFRPTGRVVPADRNQAVVAPPAGRVHNPVRHRHAQRHYAHQPLHALDEEGVGFRDAIVQGSMERLSPILMTAFVTGIGLLPLALGAGEPGKEIQRPMTVVILGGIVTSTFLNMIVIPALYLKHGRGVAHVRSAEYRDDQERVPAGD